MLPEHMESPDPTVGPSYITETGALSCSSGLRTGRVPKDKRIVYDDETKDVSKKISDLCSSSAIDYPFFRKFIGALLTLPASLNLSLSTDPVPSIS